MLPGFYGRLAASLILLVLAALLLLPSADRPRAISWDDLIAPLGIGQPLARGYMLAPPHRGNAHDVVYVARREPGPAGPAGRVEVHIVDRGRWSGIPETRSFGIGWEVPPAGTLVAASEDDARAVRDALVEAIAKNDTGFSSVDAIPLASEPAPPPIVCVLERVSGIRGAVIGAAVAAALALLVPIPGGPIAVGVLLFAVGFALRAASLDVPFVNDQDVQRLLTGNLPLRDIATGSGLKDRHPPLYFFLLHFIEQFGQSEAVGRAPAVVAGALAAPAVLLATASMYGRISATAVLAAFAVAVSPELVGRSREVSEIPLFALIVIAAAASLVAAAREPRRGRLAMLAASHALAFYTYYLAPFIVAAHAAVLAWLRRPNRRVVWAFALGVGAGTPALLLGMVTLLRDWQARDVARAFPALAWGEHSPAQMAADMARLVAEGLGLPLLVLICLAVMVGAVRRNPAVVTPALGVTATFVGTALASAFVRVQIYYVSTVVPLALLALAAAPEPSRSRYRLAWLAALMLAIAFGTVPLLAGTRALYVPAADAFMPRFASLIAERPEATVVTIAHYDKTLLAYYLARADGRAIAWSNLDDPRTKSIEGLVSVHGMHSESEQRALERLEEVIAAGPILVIERDRFLLPSLVQRLARCEPVLQAPTARLLRCAPSG